MKKILFSLIILIFGTQLFAQNPLKTENVFLITLDGLRWQELYTGADEKLISHEDYVRNSEDLTEAFWDDDPDVRKQLLMPFFWSVIVEKGQLYGNRAFGNRVDVANGLNFSYPGYSEILVGYVDEEINSNARIPNPNTTVLEFVNNQPGFRGKVAAFGSWDVFPYIINSERSGIPVNAGFDPVEGDDLTDREVFLNKLLHQIPSPWGTVRLDAFTHHYAVEHIRKHEPRLVYIAYGETDDFAHDGNYQAYLYSARQTDAFIRELWEMVQSHPVYKDKTTLIITTDHGRGTDPIDHWRHHGSRIEGSEEIWIAVIGPDSPATGIVKEPMQLYQKQVAKTVARFLGLEYVNQKPVGPVIESVFNPN
ncbi:MAG: phosphoglyceromutase [Balneolaceae bacterium]|nr:MAG: phosphoglyceromutase [Balneolaceae bacterium]